MCQCQHPDHQVGDLVGVELIITQLLLLPLTWLDGIWLVHNHYVWLGSPSPDRPPWYLAHKYNVHIWHVRYHSRAVHLDFGFKSSISRRLSAWHRHSTSRLATWWHPGWLVSLGVYQMQVFFYHVDAKPSQEEICTLPLPETLCFSAVGHELSRHVVGSQWQCMTSISKSRQVTMISGSRVQCAHLTCSLSKQSCASGLWVQVDHL